MDLAEELQKGKTNAYVDEEFTPVRTKPQRHRGSNRM
jgi:hypothetical protein